MEIEFSVISKNLKTLREMRQLTQEEIAKELGVSRQSIISLEQGRCLPSLPLALSIADFFNLALDSFFQPNIAQSANQDNGKEVKNMTQDLMPFSPMREISHLHDTIDRLFEETWPISEKTVVNPIVNIYEKENTVIVKADVPGVKEDDLNIEVGEDYLILRGERKFEEEIDKKDFYRREVLHGAFSRTIGLPAEVDKDKAEAELKDGMLSISLPKKTKTIPKVTKIKVKKA